MSSRESEVSNAGPSSTQAHSDAVTQSPAGAVESGQSSGVGRAVLQRKIQQRALQRKAGGGSAGGAPAASAGGGGALPGFLREKFEAEMKADFSDVRILLDGQAEKVGALAFTQGNEIHFASGQYQPESPQGQKLIGHELAHVIQQREGRVKATIQTKGAAVNDDPALEAEADAMGEKAASAEAPAHADGGAHAKGGGGGAASAAAPVQKKAATSLSSLSQEAKSEAPSSAPVIQRALKMTAGYTEGINWSAEAKALIASYDRFVELLTVIEGKAAGAVPVPLKERATQLHAYRVQLEATQITNNFDIRVQKTHEIDAKIELEKALDTELSAALHVPPAPAPKEEAAGEPLGDDGMVTVAKGKASTFDKKKEAKPAAAGPGGEAPTTPAATGATPTKAKPPKPDAESGVGATAVEGLRDELLKPEFAKVEGEKTLSKTATGKTTVKGEANLMALEGSGELESSNKTAKSKAKTTIGGAEVEGQLGAGATKVTAKAGGSLLTGDANAELSGSKSHSVAKASIKAGKADGANLAGDVSAGNLAATGKASLAHKDGEITGELSGSATETLVAANLKLNAKPLKFSLFGEEFTAKASAKVDGFIGAKEQAKLSLVIKPGATGAEAHLEGAEGIAIEPPTSAPPAATPTAAHGASPAPSGGEHATPAHAEGAETASKGSKVEVGGSVSAFAGAKARLELAGELDWTKQSPTSYAHSAAGNAETLLKSWLPARVVGYIPTSYFPTLLEFVMPFLIGQAGDKKIVGAMLGGEASAGIGAEAGFNASFEGGEITCSGKAGLTLGPGVSGDFKLALGAVEGMRALTVLFMKGSSALISGIQPSQSVQEFLLAKAAEIRRQLQVYFQQRVNDPSVGFFARKVAKGISYVI